MRFDFQNNIVSPDVSQPLAVAARSKAWTVFDLSNAGTVGSYPTQAKDVCPRSFCVCIGSGLAKGWSPVQGVL
jgi:hypothetical protein